MIQYFYHFIFFTFLSLGFFASTQAMDEERGGAAAKRLLSPPKAHLEYSKEQISVVLAVLDLGPHLSAVDKKKKAEAFLREQKATPEGQEETGKAGATASTEKVGNPLFDHSAAPEFKAYAREELKRYREREKRFCERGVYHLTGFDAKPVTFLASYNVSGIGSNCLFRSMAPFLPELQEKRGEIKTRHDFLGHIRTILGQKTKQSARIRGYLTGAAVNDHLKTAEAYLNSYEGDRTIECFNNYISEISLLMEPMGIAAALADIAGVNLIVHTQSNRQHETVHAFEFHHPDEGRPTHYLMLHEGHYRPLLIEGNKGVTHEILLEYEEKSLYVNWLTNVYKGYDVPMSILEHRLSILRQDYEIARANAGYLDFQDPGFEKPPEVDFALEIRHLETAIAERQTRMRIARRAAAKKEVAYTQGVKEGTRTTGGGKVPSENKGAEAKAAAAAKAKRERILARAARTPAEQAAYEKRIQARQAAAKK